METPCPVLPHFAMGSRLICCVALCLLGAGPVDSGVTQTPRHLIKAKGQQMTLRCSPMSGHKNVFWYKQDLDQGPEFLVRYYDGEESEKGNFPDRFSAQQFSDYSSELIMSSLQLEDSALYLCASSLGTALQSHRHSVYKPPCPSKEQPQI